MNKEKDESDSEGIKELQKFYDMKKNEQVALRKLLQQLEKKTSQSDAKERPNHSLNK